MKHLKENYGKQYNNTTKGTCERTGQLQFDGFFQEIEASDKEKVEEIV